MKLASPVKNSGVLQWHMISFLIRWALGQLAMLRTLVTFGMKFAMVVRGRVTCWTRLSKSSFIVSLTLVSIFSFMMLMVATIISVSLSCWNCVTWCSLLMLISWDVVHMTIVFTVVAGNDFRIGFVIVSASSILVSMISERSRAWSFTVLLSVAWSSSESDGNLPSNLVVMPYRLSVSTLRLVLSGLWWCLVKVWFASIPLEHLISVTLTVYGMAVVRLTVLKLGSCGVGNFKGIVLTAPSFSLDVVGSVVIAFVSSNVTKGLGYCGVYWVNVMRMVSALAVSSSAGMRILVS